MNAFGQLFRALFICYPLVLHFCIGYGYQPAAAWYLAILLIFPAVSAVLRSQRVTVFEVATALIAIALLTVLRTHEMLLFKLLPFTIYAFLFWLSAASLRLTETPVITRIALAINPDLTTAEKRYTRSVTLAWAAFFLLMGAVSTLLAVYAPAEYWSWFVNIISYGLLALFFVAEYLVRRLVLGDRVDYSFTEFIGRMRRLNMRNLLFPGD